MAMYIPGARVQRGPGWDNLEANQRAMQGLLAGFQSIQEAKKERANQNFLANLMSAGQSGGPQAMTSAIQTPAQGPENLLAKIINPINPFQASSGYAPVQQNLMAQTVADQIDPTKSLAKEKTQAQIDQLRSRTETYKRNDPYLINQLIAARRQNERIRDKTVEAQSRYLYLKDLRGSDFDVEEKKEHERETKLNTAKMKTLTEHLKRNQKKIEELEASLNRGEDESNDEAQQLWDEMQGIDNEEELQELQQILSEDDPEKIKEALRRIRGV